MIQYYPQEQQMKHKAAGVDYPGRFFVIFITVIQCSVGFSLQANDPLQNQVQGIFVTAAAADQDQRKKEKWEVEIKKRFRVRTRFNILDQLLHYYFLWSWENSRRS